LERFVQSTAAQRGNALDLKLRTFTTGVKAGAFGYLPECLFVRFRLGKELLRIAAFFTDVDCFLNKILRFQKIVFESFTEDLRLIKIQIDSGLLFVIQILCMSLHFLSWL
jgi:hypothetical protein